MNTYKNLNYIETQLIVWGEPFDCCNNSDVIVCITGNPGVPDFYIEFASYLYATTKLPVCVIGQAGHIEVADYLSNVLQNQEHLLNLEGQLNHKLDLLNNHIDKNRKLHLIGHSIGAWMVTELIDRNDDLLKRVASVNFLFPTLQNMAKTRNGKFLNNILRPINYLVVLLFSFFHILPFMLKEFLINLYLKSFALPSFYLERILKYMNPKVGEKVLFLAFDEMDSVISLNTNGIDKFKHLTNVIYSNNDGWAPLHYIEDLKIFQPAIQMNKVQIDHAFVLKSSIAVGDLVAKFIMEKYVSR